MPLFKRTQKRMARKAMEDETGLTKIKAALREENDGAASESSDEDESGSESGSGSGSEDGPDVEMDEEIGELSDEDSDSDDDEEVGENAFMANRRREKRRAEGLDSEEEEDDDEEDDESDDEDDDDMPLTLEEALVQPLYAITTSRIITDAQGGQHETKGTVSCVYCPNRILKNDNMVQIHLKSTGHSRAQKRFLTQFEGMKGEDDVALMTVDPRDIVADIEDELASRTARVEDLPKRKRTAAEREADEDEDEVGETSKAQRRLLKKAKRNEARAERPAGTNLSTPVKETEGMPKRKQKLTRKERKAKKEAESAAAGKTTPADAAAEPAPTSEPQEKIAESSATLVKKAKKAKKAVA